MTFRERAVALIAERLGEPEASHSERGINYRWRLPRQGQQAIHIIVDSPERTDQIHVLISDPCPEVIEPVRSVHLKLLEDVQKLIDEVESQWRLEPCWMERTQTGQGSRGTR